MIKKRPLNLHAQRAVDELSDKHGIKCDLEESLWLDRLGENIDSPPGASNLHLIGRPARCGNVILWPFTIGAAIWWRECAGIWFEGKGQEVFVMAYALAHSREPEKFEMCRDYRTTKKIVKKWSRRLGATSAEMEYAIDVVGDSMDSGNPPDILPKPKTKEEEEEEIKRGERSGLLLDAVAELALCYGGGLDYWTWGIDRDTALHKLAICRQIERARNPKSASDLPDPNNPEALAFKCMRVAIIEILRARGFTFTDQWIAIPPDGWQSEVCNG